ncbi:DUF2249 domain-containing protein [Roseateles paludis]|uniref:DUF2249 domain-containing protein n=1 Tax=Roseateles paludis TaxID=3145238 RepID=A0ABV0FWC3_9BURK
MTAHMPTYDLRPLAPYQRHELAFSSFDALAVGQAFEFINDHEPRGLLIQMAEQRPGSFDWQVMESAPGVWRIRVTRLDSAAAAPDTGGCGGCSCGGKT